MGFWVKVIALSNLLAFAILGLLLLAVYHDIYPLREDVPPLENIWFGEGVRPQEEDASIKPFRINIGENELKDLKMRLENDLSRLKNNHPGPIVDSFRYGINLDFVTAKMANHWIKKYDWKKQEIMLNAMGSHHTTNIHGLDVHFVVAKPHPKLAKGKRILPLLMVHGWPGSFVEFAKIIPLLTTPRPDREFVFEVITPSIPGYGFSSSPQKAGFHVGQCARVFKTLMSRLGHEKFYTQGGDWGSAITAALATMYPNIVLGTHLNMPFVGAPASHLRALVTSIFPGLFLETQELEYAVPFTEQIVHLISESGYFHIQATRPDTVGIGLNTSPLGLASYIIEKFATCTSVRSNNTDSPDGNLLNMFTMDELINNVMIYWWSGSITSSMRFYKENAGNTDNQPFLKALSRKHLHVPVGVASCANEIIFVSKLQLDTKFKRILSYNVIPGVGHFAAYEAPEKLAEDFVRFVKVVENEKSSKPKKEL